LFTVCSFCDRLDATNGKYVSFRSPDHDPRSINVTNSRFRRSTSLAAVGLLSLGLVAGACSKSSDKAGDTGGKSATTAVDSAQFKNLTGELNGTGSSFQDTLEQKVKVEFQKVAPGVTVNYNKSGSKGGKKDLAGRVVQFAGTDSLINDEEKPGFTSEVLYIPIAGAPIAVAYNVPEVEKLTLSADTISGIFQGEITTWNDPKIAKENPDAKLPSTKIAGVHRSDGSGTTSNFTKFLKAASPSWKLGSGDTVTWPTTTQGAEKNSGVATLISQTPGAVGYVDLADAAKANLKMASVINKEGKAVEPKLAGATAALESAEVKDDLTFDPINAPGATAYPITSPTWILVYAQQPAELKDAIKGYLHFMLTEGQKLAPANGYAALPEGLAKKAIAHLDKITA
jgi:phosphate transport system substrate-binding protein